MAPVQSGQNGLIILNVQSHVALGSNQGHVNALEVLLVSIVSDWKKNLPIANQKSVLRGLIGPNFHRVAPPVGTRPRSDRENVKMATIALVNPKMFNSVT